MIKAFEFKGQMYPQFQKEWFAARFAFPFAKEFCKGNGYDIGCHKKEWALPGSIPIDTIFKDGLEAMKLPQPEVDYIFSSHCLEHLDDWVAALEYWVSKLKKGGVLFLYCPSYQQEYWRPWNCRKHKHVLNTTSIVDCLLHFGCNKIFTSGDDLNDSFTIVAEKA